MEKLISQEFEACMEAASREGYRGIAIGRVAAMRRCGQLGISNSAWADAVEVMGLRLAMLALTVIDRNRSHPSRPVQKPGGAMRAITERIRAGEGNIALSAESLLRRQEAGRQPRIVPNGRN